MVKCDDFFKVRTEIFRSILTSFGFTKQYKELYSPFRKSNFEQIFILFSHFCKKNSASKIS